MADGRTHAKWFAITSIFFIVVLAWLNLYKFIPLLILSNSIVDPDEDQKWLKGRAHRHFLTHSVLWALIVGGAFILVLGIPPLTDILIMYLVLSVPLITHLFLDLLSKNDEGKYRFFGMSHKRLGKYYISFYPSHRKLKAWGTIVWLLVNIAIIIVYSWFTLQYVYYQS